MIEGNVGKPPKEKYTQDGKRIVSFSIAHSSGKGDKKHTLWLDVETWDQFSQQDAMVLKGGERVIVDGDLTHREWTKDGATKLQIGIRATKIRALLKLERGEKQSEKAPPLDAGPTPDDGDLPF